jgi:hypothetical protein
MTKWVTRLWQGEIGLASSFWEFGILYGTLVHLISTGVAFGAFVLGTPAWLAVTLFFLPAPYTVLVVVGVWRSAERYRGPAKRAHGARIGIVIWAVLATVL